MDKAHLTMGGTLLAAVIGTAAWLLWPSPFSCSSSQTRWGLQEVMRERLQQGKPTTAVFTFDDKGFEEVSNHGSVLVCLARINFHMSGAEPISLPVKYAVEKSRDGQTVRHLPLF